MIQKKYQLKRINETGLLLKKNDEALFVIDYKKELNAAQYEAASAVEGAYLIIAGAGSGKTRTLVYRVARLIELGYQPQSILLLTFTRKAANEMMNRASLLLDNRCSKINGGTFHSFANSILRKYAKVIGFASAFTILDQGDSQDVINLIRSQSGFAKKEKRFPNKQTLNKVLSFSVNTGKKVEEILLDDYPHFYEFTDDFLAVQKVYDSYKKKNNLLDYDDLLVYLRDFLLSLSPTAKTLLQSFNFVMVDEYQDTNKLQAEVVKALTQLKQNIMVVGDDSQSIYAFRGANFKNIMDFPNLYNNVKLIKLEENYRSTPEVLNFANKIVEEAVEKYPKVLFTQKLPGVLPAIVATQNVNLQSKFIVDKILDLREEGIPLSDIAVLFRSSYSSFDLEIELTKANLPFVKYGGMKFVETAHIKDVLAFLRISLNPKDVVSWYRVLLLHEGVGPKTAERILEELATGTLQTIQDPQLISKTKLTEKVIHLLRLLFRLNTNKATPTEKAKEVIEYYQPIFISKYDDYNKRKKDLDIFLNITEKYRSMESLLSDMVIEPPIDSAVDLEETTKEDEFVTLSTIHSAKGLEWHSVFIIHAIDGFFPSYRSIDKLETLEEERRLMYVAVTRAKQNLFISYPMNIYDRESGTTLSMPSRFIAEISEKLAEGWLLEE